MKRLILGISLGIVGSVTLRSAPAQAWGSMGHQVVGEIAQQNLDEKGRQFVHSILGAEDLKIAATWPDDLRDDTRYDAFKAYHFCEILNADIPRDELRAQLLRERNCFSILNDGARKLADPTVPRDLKIILLRYLVHVGGDVHQPLHVGNSLDAGANACKVDLPGHVRPLESRDHENLHSIWDDVMVEELSHKLKSAAIEQAHANHERAPGFWGQKQVANAIVAQQATLLPGDAAAHLSQDPIEWLVESVHLRQTAVYPAIDASVGFSNADERLRPYCHHRVSDNTVAPLLTADYMSRSEDLIQVQLLKAGIRVGRLINAIAAQVPNLPTETDENLIHGVLDMLSPGPAVHAQAAPAVSHEN